MNISKWTRENQWRTLCPLKRLTPPGFEIPVFLAKSALVGTDLSPSYTMSRVSVQTQRWQHCTDDVTASCERRLHDCTGGAAVLLGRNLLVSRQTEGLAAPGENALEEVPGLLESHPGHRWRNKRVISLSLPVCVWERERRKQRMICILVNELVRCIRKYYSVY